MPTMNDENQQTQENLQEEKERMLRANAGYQAAMRQILSYVITAFITYLLMGFNSSWLLGIQFSPLYATILSIVFMRFGIPLAILGYALQQAGVSFPVFTLNIQ